MRRNYMATINFDQNGGSPLRFLPSWEDIRGLKQVTFQLELASRLHWQCFLEFEYPVSLGQIVKDVHAQGKQMHIAKPGDARVHPKAGRSYVTKGTAVDGHRYFWSRAKGYIGIKPPTGFCDDNDDDDSHEQTKQKLRQITFDGSNKDEVRRRLIEMHKICKNYILKSVDSIKIV